MVAPHRERVPLDPAEPGGEPLAFATAEQALAWCEQERGNLVAATRQAASRGLHDIAWKLPAAMKNGFDRLGYRTEWLATHRIALASARELGDRPGEAWVLNNLGMVLGQQHVHDAIGYFEQALAIYREIGDRRDQALAANNLAFCYLVLGRYDEAVAALLRALQLQREAGRRYGEGVALCNLVEAYVELGRYNEAIAISQEALAVIREVGSVRDEGYALYNLGRAHLELGRSRTGGRPLPAGAGHSSGRGRQVRGGAGAAAGRRNPRQGGAARGGPRSLDACSQPVRIHRR